VNTDVTPDSDRIADQLAALRVQPTSTEQHQRAALAMCAVAARGFDLDDPAQRKAAAGRALPVLLALGYLAEPEDAPEVHTETSRLVHGTRSAVQFHLDTRTPLCKPCLRCVEVDARKGIATARTDGTAPAQPTVDPRCGTRNGYRAHHRRGELPCEKCRDAHREYERARYQPAPRQRAVCGTETAYKRHRSHGEDVCEACRIAHNAYERDRKAVRRASAQEAVRDG
jgi:hypothetical protein